MKELPYMPLFGKDAWGDEKFNALPLDVQGLFWRLAYWQWQEGSIPADPKTVGMTIAKPRETQRMWSAIRRFFKPIAENPERLANAYVTDLREQMLKKRKSQSDGAYMTNNKRWRSHTDSVTDAEPIHTRVELTSIASDGMGDMRGAGSTLQPPPWQAHDPEPCADSLCRVMCPELPQPHCKLCHDYGIHHFVGKQETA